MRWCSQGCHHRERMLRLFQFKLLQLRVLWILHQCRPPVAWRWFLVDPLRWPTQGKSYRCCGKFLFPLASLYSSQWHFRTCRLLWKGYDQQSVDSSAMQSWFRVNSNYRKVHPKKCCKLEQLSAQSLFSAKPWQLDQEDSLPSYVRLLFL